MVVPAAPPALRARGFEVPPWDSSSPVPREIAVTIVAGVAEACGHGM